MNSRAVIQGLKIATASLAGIILSSCNSQESWAPKSPAESPIEGFETTTSHSFNDWIHVFMSAEDAEAKNPMGQAMLLKEGNFELPFNLFAIPMAGPNYVESQYEVLYYDDKMTQIRVVEAEGDQLAIIMDSGSVDQSMSITHAFIYPGARIRLSGEVYEIHADGWHHEGDLIHAFENAPSTD